MKLSQLDHYVQPTAAEALAELQQLQQQRAIVIPAGQQLPANCSRAQADALCELHDPGAQVAHNVTLRRLLKRLPGAHEMAGAELVQAAIAAGKLATAGPTIRRRRPARGPLDDLL